MRIDTRLLVAAVSVLLSSMCAVMAIAGTASAQSPSSGLLVIEGGQVVIERSGIMVSRAPVWQAPSTGTSSLVCDRCPPCMVFLISPGPNPSDWTSGFVAVNGSFSVRAGETYNMNLVESETEQRCGGRLPDGRFRYWIR